MKLSLVIAAAIAPLLPHSPAPPVSTSIEVIVEEQQAAALEELLEKAREASGFGALKPGAGVTVRGEAQLYSAPGQVVAVYARDGRFSTAVDGVLSRSVTFDGTHAWEKELSAGPYNLQLFAREWAFLRAWVHSGFWLTSEAPVSINALPSSPNSVQVQLTDGILVATVTLDEQSYLPTRLDLPNGNSKLIVELADYALSGGVQLARNVHTRIWEGQEVSWQLEAKATIYELGQDAFPKQARTPDTTFDPSVNPSVEIVRSDSKHLYVRPKINGKELGLFVFDTGAGFTGISVDASVELGLAPIGDSSLTGLGGAVTANKMARLDTFQLGPITIRNLVVSQTRQRKNSEINGEPVVGVIGWDLLMRAVLDFSAGEGGLTILDPNGFVMEDAQWAPLSLHYQVPYVSVKIPGDIEGLFMVDTGAAGKTLYFFADDTRRLGLREGQKENPISKGRGAGGSFSQTLGEIEWAEIATCKRLDDLVIVFGLGDDGEVDPYSLGLLGGGLLRGYRTVIDYSRNRMAFFPLWW